MNHVDEYDTDDERNFDDGSQPRAFTTDEGEDAESAGMRAAMATDDLGPMQTSPYLAGIDDRDGAGKGGDEPEPSQLGWTDVIEATAKADEEKVRKTRERTVLIAGEKRVLREGEKDFEQPIDVPFPDAEFRARTKVVIAKSREISLMEEELKEQNKAARGRIAEKKSEWRKLAAEVESGSEAILVPCVEVRVDELGEMRTLRCDTGEVISVRAMTYQERQLPLPAPKADPTDVTASGVGVVEDAPKKKRGRPRKEVVGDA